MKSAALVPEINSTSASAGPTVQNNGDDCDAVEVQVFIPSHPLNVKPSGNKYSASQDARNAIGIFQILPDEILAVLLEYFDSNSLRHLGATCKALYAFSRLEDLWKALLVE
jgi:hypothetical protein